MRIELPAFPVEGGCQCGAVRYRITGAPLAVYNCHCRDCQRSSGATHSMSMPIARERLEHLSGELTAYDKAAVLLATRYRDWGPTSETVRAAFIDAYDDHAREPLTGSERESIDRRVAAVLKDLGWT